MKTTEAAAVTGRFFNITVDAHIHEHRNNFDVSCSIQVQVLDYTYHGINVNILHIVRPTGRKNAGHGPNFRAVSRCPRIGTRMTRILMIFLIMTIYSNIIHFNSENWCFFFATEMSIHEFNQNKNKHVHAFQWYETADDRYFNKRSYHIFNFACINQIEQFFFSKCLHKTYNDWISCIRKLQKLHPTTWCKSKLSVRKKLIK